MNRIEALTPEWHLARREAGMTQSALVDLLVCRGAMGITRYLRGFLDEQEHARFDAGVASCLEAFFTPSEDAWHEIAARRKQLSRSISATYRGNWPAIIAFAQLIAASRSASLWLFLLAAPIALAIYSAAQIGLWLAQLLGR